MYSPFTILAKLLLRQLWQLKVSWDELLPDDIVTEWKAWTSQLPSLTSQAIPRKYSPCPELVIHTALHGFSNASKDAYGAVVYVRQLDRDGRITTSLVISKARVAPLKSLTIPRAELAGAYLLAKLLSYSAHILCVTEINAWTDSAIILCWLRKVPSSLNVFVGNRVAAIHELLLDAKWRHVNTHNNPADILSRGSSTTNLNISHLWWEGPPWLRLPPEQWPPPQFTVLTELPETSCYPARTSLAFSTVLGDLLLLHDSRKDIRLGSSFRSQCSSTGRKKATHSSLDSRGMPLHQTPILPVGSS